MKANLSEIFYSIQGEGLTIGAPAIFIRLCGCNLNCPFCDTKYAIDCTNWIGYETIKTIVRKFSGKRIIFTGGEPALQDEFMAFFMEKNPDFIYQIETNGTVLFKKSIKLFDHITISPKMFALKKDVLMELKETAKSVEFKFVVDENFENELNLVKELNLPRVVFQPVWLDESREYYLAKTRKIIEKVKTLAPNIRVIPQLHKILYGFKRGI